MDARARTWDQTGRASSQSKSRPSDVAETHGSVIGIGLAGDE